MSADIRLLSDEERARFEQSMQSVPHVVQEQGGSLSGNRSESANEAAGDPWPDPLPVVVAHARRPYPIDALPEYMCDAIAEVQAYTQAPIAMVATCALGTLSTACQGNVDVARDSRLTGPTSLYTLILAFSGERKSTVDGYFTRPITEYEAEQRRTMAPEVREHEAHEATHKAKRDGLLARIRGIKKGSTPRAGKTTTSEGSKDD